MSDTFDRIKNLVAEHLDIEESKVKPDSSFDDDLGADSLDSVEIIMALEEDFEIEITDEEAQALITIQNAVDFVDEKIELKEDL